MKKIVMGILLSCLALNCSTVFADAYYTNDNGLEFTEFQYNLMTNILNETLVAEMSEEEYDNFGVNNMNPENTKLALEEGTENDSGIMPLGTFHETQSKKFSITSTCSSSNCMITTTVVWKKSPAVRSYDVMGHRITNTSFTSTAALLTLDTNKDLYTYDDKKGASNGIGCAVKLPSDETINYIAMSTTVQPQGRVYGSYQHAIKNITLSTAMNFSFSDNGYGNVFLYPSSYDLTFDQMAGVYLVLD